MGKSKKRSIALGKNQQIPTITREEAVEKIVEIIEDKDEAMKLITLFGITAEELLEAGATYEDVVAFGNLIK